MQLNAECVLGTVMHVLGQTNARSGSRRHQFTVRGREPQSNPQLEKA